MRIVAAVCVVAMLWLGVQSSVYPSCSFSLHADQVSIKPDMHWTLSSRWMWNASGVGDHAGWRIESENWNDTLTVEEVSGGEFTLRLKRLGDGSSEAQGSFIIGGRARDSWTIDREYSFKINSTTFRDTDGRPVRWIINVKDLKALRSLPQMWTDEDYRYVEVQFRASGSDRVSVGGVALDTWVVSYRNQTTGYWSAEGNHSSGFKEEVLEYDQARGLLLADTYHGAYGIKTSEGGWNETETYVATAIDSNFALFDGVESGSLTNGVIIAGAFVAAGIAVLAIIRRRRIPSKRTASQRQ
jgi:hypothetical protein